MNSSIFIKSRKNKFSYQGILMRILSYKDCSLEHFYQSQISSEAERTKLKLAVSVFVSFLVGTVSSRTQPNIIFILADDLGNLNPKLIPFGFQRNIQQARTLICHNFFSVTIVRRRERSVFFQTCRFFA